MFKTSSIDKSNIGMESLTREYKEVFLHCIEKYFTEKDLIEFIKINKINEYKFNKAISTTIRSYILSYLPKYIGAYNNAKIIGDLYFGIDDIGDKIGIPFFGTLNKKTILRALNQTHVYLRAYDNGKLNKELINFILQNISIDISHINENISNEHDHISNLNEFTEIDKSVQQEWANYFEKYYLWHKEIMFYSTKLSNFLDSIPIRIEIANWIRTFINNPKFKKYNLEEIAVIYETNGYINKDISFDVLDLVRHDYSHPLKWLMDFKDYKHITLKRQKPYSPLIKPIKNIYSKFCNNIKNISYPLQEQGAKFYIIKFTIPFIENSWFEFYSDKQRKWYSKSRVNTDRGPACC